VNYPEIAQISQHIDTTTVADIDQVIAAEMQRLKLRDRVKSGARVALSAGSRGITDSVAVIRAVIHELKQIGAQPVIIPSMGSHGGATAEGQAEMLEGLGLSEKTLGAPVVSSMGVVELGKTEEGIPVVFSKDALACDNIIVINRIKPHTEFSGKIESGLTKMLVIGMGKHEGAIRTHNWAVRFGYEQTLISSADLLIKKVPVAMGIGIVENGFGQAARIEAVSPENFVEEEVRLLEYARQTCPHLPFDRLDVLIVDEGGKEISGTCMDTKVIGRIMNIYEPPLTHPYITRIVLRDITNTSHGNGLGIGLADFVTRRLTEKLNRSITDLNCVTAVAPEKARLPIVAETDRDAINQAIATAGPVTPDDIRLCWIKNTMKLDTMYVSKALLEEVSARSELKKLTDLTPMNFNEADELLAPQ
jgi:hypothetical protein